MRNLRQNSLHLTLMSLAAILAIFSWIVAFCFYDKLPGIIPTHFGFSGMPDAWSEKSVLFSFMIPALQTIMLGAFIFLYEKPQYSDMPTTLLLTSLPKSHREHAFALIRVMLVGTALWLGLLFSYLTYAMNTSALLKTTGLSPYIMGCLLAGMFTWLGWYTIRVYRYTKKFLAKSK